MIIKTIEDYADLADHLIVGKCLSYWYDIQSMLHQSTFHNIHLLENYASQIS